MKKVFSYALLIPAFIGMMFACSTVKTDVKKLDGEWSILEVKGEKVLEAGLPQMNFDMTGNKVRGNAGCNIFNTTVTLDPNDVSAITIAPAATTMMACPNMEQEDAILRAMLDVAAVKAGQSAKELLLVDKDGNVLLVLSKN